MHCIRRRYPLRLKTSDSRYKMRGIWQSNSGNIRHFCDYNNQEPDVKLFLDFFKSKIEG